MPATGSIITLTLNPALDLSTSVGDLQPWRKMRCNEPTMEAGGGGINVSRAIHELGGQTVAIAALGGHVGALVANVLRRQNIPLRRVNVAGETRQNYSVTETSTGNQFRFVHPGAEMATSAWRRCLSTLMRTVTDASCVVASSSLPLGIPDDAFAQLAWLLEPTGIPLIVDTSGLALAAAIKAPCTLVKPSVNELSAVVGQPLTNLVDYEEAARQLLAAGRCRAIATSLGEDGAIFVPRDGAAFLVSAPKVSVVSTSGAGDSMVAAMAIALGRGESLVEAGRFGVAAGTAAVLANGTGLCRRSDVETLLPLTSVTFDAHRTPSVSPVRPA